MFDEWNRQNFLLGMLLGLLAYGMIALTLRPVIEPSMRRIDPHWSFWTGMLH